MDAKLFTHFPAVGNRHYPVVWLERQFQISPSLRVVFHREQEELVVRREAIVRRIGGRFARGGSVVSRSSEVQWLRFTPRYESRARHYPSPRADIKKSL